MEGWATFLEALYATFFGEKGREIYIRNIVALELSQEMSYSYDSHRENEIK